MFADKHINDTDPIIFKKKNDCPKKQQSFSHVIAEDNLQTKTEIKQLLKQRITDVRIQKGYNTRNALANAMRINVHIIDCAETGKGNISK